MKMQSICRGPLSGLTMAAMATASLSWAGDYDAKSVIDDKAVRLLARRAMDVCHGAPAIGQDDVWRTHSTIFAESFAGSEVGSDLRRLKDQRRS